jgi:hypothetical protein
VPNQRAADQTKLSISMPRSLLDAMEKYCQERDITKSQYIRRLLRDDHAMYGTVPDVPAVDHAAGEGCPHRRKKAAS